MNYRQVDMIRAALDAGEELTPLDALTRFGCMSLSQRIGELRRSGYPVQSERWETPSGKYVSRYFKMLIPFG